MLNDKRPTVASVFGVLNTILGGLGTLQGVLGITIFFKSYGMFGGSIYIANALAYAFSLFTGLLLLMNKKNAVALAQIQATLAILISTSMGVFLFFTGYGVLTGILAIILGSFHPVLLIFLVVRNAKVRKFYDAR